MTRLEKVLKAETKNSAKRAPAPREGSLHSIIQYSNALNNLVATVEALNALAYLQNPYLMKEFWIDFQKTGRLWEVMIRPGNPQNFSSLEETKRISKDLEKLMRALRDLKKGLVTLAYDTEVLKNICCNPKYSFEERKERRKNKRLEKKKNRLKFNQRSSKNAIVSKDGPQMPVNVKQNEKNSKTESIKPTKKVNRQKPEENLPLAEREYDSESEEETTNLTRAQVKVLQHKEAIEDEDKEIKRLEKLLKLNKRKKKTNKLPQGFKDMGLDYIMDFIDGPKDDIYNDKDATKELLGIFAKDKMKDSDIGNEESDSENEGLKSKAKPKIDPLNKKNLSKVKDEEKGKKLNTKEKTVSKRKAETELKILPNKKMKKTLKNETYEEEIEENGSSEDENEEEIEENDAIEDENEEIEENDSDENEVDEDESLEDEEGLSSHDDIYGQKNAQEKKQEVAEVKTEELELALKSLNHCLKFVRDLEFHVISKLIQELYQEHSRAVMNQSLMSHLEKEVLLTKFLQDEEIIVKYAQIVASLHATIGSEVGAYILQNTALKFESAYKAEEISHCMNIITFLSYLYVFNVTHSLLLIDILAMLGQKVSELDIQLILAVMKSVGFHLRKSDVPSTEGLIANLTEVLRSKFPTQEEGNNVKLLLDILHAIKTRSLYKKLVNDPSEVDRQKKQIKFQLPKGTEVQDLKFSYQDLLKAEGKVGWWIVGGGWEDGTAQPDNPSNPLGSVKLPKFDKKIEKLAEAFNMNTELRKAIFCILMSYDLNEIFGRIQSLKLKSPHERDVVVVIVNTCLHYRKFTPLFGNLLGMLCEKDRRKYFMPIQCCLWDRMKEIEDLTDRQLNIFSKLFSQLLTDSVVPITILKSEYFTTPSHNVIGFIKTLLLKVLMTASEYNCHSIFSKIANLRKFTFLCESIKAYLNYHVTTTRPKMEPADQAKFDKRHKMVLDALNPILY
ncbi:NOM1 [Cordylochernes scorpioides]|uniref:NOM1 n=1 Tax=Cordylochernes scorpioides TaxID=51811 RepID=A0ABY6L9E4_9ARAC|nr:NOM1 [Cordylochernes scorpioides]